MESVTVDDFGLSTTYQAPDIEKDGGKPAAIASFLKRLEDLASSLHADLWLTDLAFGNSVTVQLQPKIEPRQIARVNEVLTWEAKPSEIQREVAEILPRSVVGAEAVVDLLAQPSQDGLVAASEYSIGTLNAYAKFAKAVEKDFGTLVVHSKRGGEATFGHEKARKVIASTPDPERMKRVKFKISGRLARADSDEELFRVTLDGRDVPDLWDKRRKHVEGRYSDAAHAQVQDGGLWDNHVLATVSAVPLIDLGRTRARLDEFRFEAVELFPL